MPLPRPVTYCPICGHRVRGRKDKIFCTVKCKSKYHTRRKLQHTPVTLPVDKILHRNWVVLTERHELAGKSKFFANRASLARAGFNYQFYTTSRTNKEGKTYYYIYNFGWMDFSEKQIMVVKLKKAP